MIDGSVILSRKFKHPEYGWEITGYVCNDWMSKYQEHRLIVAFDSNKILELVDYPDKSIDEGAYLSLDSISPLFKQAKRPPGELGRILTWLAKIGDILLAEVKSEGFKEKHSKELSERIRNSFRELDSLINTEI